MKEGLLGEGLSRGGPDISQSEAGVEDSKYSANDKYELPFDRRRFK